MGQEFSMSYLKKNSYSNLSIIVAAFISTLFLSLICSLFYNFWIYENEKIVFEEGDWQGRISAPITKEDLASIQNFPNVDKAIINGKLSDEQSQTVDIYFVNPRQIFVDMPLIAENIDLEKDAVSYHELLLSRYLIHNPEDKSPPLLLSFYLLILLLICFSLILIIHNAFAVSMNTRIHQLGILSSIGATPRQIKSCLIQEAAALCLLPVFAGSIMGIGGGFLILKVSNIIAKGMSGRHEAVFSYHALIYVITVLASIFTVFVSTWLPARKLSRLTPLEAIKNAGELKLKKKKQSAVLTFLFGIEGELAGNFLKAQKKALRTSNIALTSSFLAFTLMLCFFTLSGISRNYTYFERYQDAWDVMITVKNTKIEEFHYTEKIKELSEIKSSVVYQKGTLVSMIPTETQSSELLALGGIEAVTENAAAGTGVGYFVQTPFVVMDDEAYLEYCKQIGIAETLDGAIILNRIWDSVHSDFRYKEYIPYLNEKQGGILLENKAENTGFLELPVQSYTQEPPVLREEYDDYGFTVFLPLSIWNNLSESIETREKDTYICVLAKEDIILEELNVLEATLSEMVNQEYEIESENRIEEKVIDDKVQKGMMLILGAFCVILAVVGIANVFSNTLGFIRQRKREFARYTSIGMTLTEMRKMFCIEALIIAGKPLLITLPLTVVAVAFMITASYLNPVEFLEKAPIMPIMVFIIAIFAFVGLAYFLGGKRLLKNNLIDSLRDESLL